MTATEPIDRAAKLAVGTAVKFGGYTGLYRADEPLGKHGTEGKIVNVRLLQIEFGALEYGWGYTVAYPDGDIWGDYAEAELLAAGYGDAAIELSPEHATPEAALVALGG